MTGLPTDPLFLALVYETAALAEVLSEAAAGQRPAALTGAEECRRGRVSTLSSPLSGGGPAPPAFIPPGGGKHAFTVEPARGEDPSQSDLSGTGHSTAQAALCEDLAAGPESVEDLLSAAMRAGAETLHRLAAAAVGRMLARGLGPAVGASLFTEGELAELADALAATLATAELLGRSLIRDWWRRVEERHGLSESAAGLSPLHEDLTAPVVPLPPEAALAYFASLVPRLGVDPDRFGPEQRRRAFTLAVATDRELLDRVHAAVLGGLAGGTAVPTGENSVEKILDAAGVTPGNPQYAEMVFRTNSMDSYNQGADDERRAPDVVATLPVWQYLHSGNTTNPRPRHRALNGKYFPASVPFAAVRGTGPADVCNCGCTQLPIDRWAWARLRAAGARIAAGYGDVPAG